MVPSQPTDVMNENWKPPSADALEKALASGDFDAAKAAHVACLQEEVRALRAFAFGDAPEWEKANTTLKHRVRELEAEKAQAVEALQAIYDRHHMAGDGSAGKVSGDALRALGVEIEE